MIHLVILAYHLGMALFLGSIATYILISALTSRAGLSDLVFARRIVRRGTLALTVPGLWLAVTAQASLALLGGPASTSRGILLPAALVVALTTHCH